MEATETWTLQRYNASQGPRKLGPKAGNAIDLGSVGVRFMAWTEETGSGFSLVEHPIPPRTLVAPLQRHSREDEYSFVLHGRMGAILGDEVIYVDTGEFAFKPRDQWHTFWNPNDTPCRILEIISPRRVRALLRRTRGPDASARLRPGADGPTRSPLWRRIRAGKPATPVRRASTTHSCTTAKR